jgi:hypothetical protein
MQNNGQPITVMQARTSVVEAPKDLAVDPEVALAGAQKAARALLKIVSQKRQIVINGKHYLTFEDWQTIGRFYGVTVGVVSTSKTDNGYAARAAVYNREGTVISAAESICTRSERTWKERDEYAIKSMAQTRACAKALRNVLAWVAVLAGFEGTPAEEIAGVNRVAGAPVSRNGQCPTCGTRGRYHAKDCPNRT